MEVTGGGDHELSFLVPRFERAKGGEKGDFPLLHSILIMPFVFIPIPSATYPHIQTPHRPHPPNTTICRRHLPRSKHHRLDLEERI